MKKIILQAIGGYTYHADQTWKAESDSNSLSGPIKDIAAADNSGADLGVFMCKDPAFYGTVGLAWVGTMCKTYYSGYNAGVNEKRENVLATSEVNHQSFIKRNNEFQGKDIVNVMYQFRRSVFVRIFF